MDPTPPANTNPDPELKRKFSESSSIGWPLVIRRLVNRAGFRLFDNPLTRRPLRALGVSPKDSGTGSPTSTLLVFRRAVVAGYRRRPGGRPGEGSNR